MLMQGRQHLFFVPDLTLDPDSQEGSGRCRQVSQQRILRETGELDMEGLVGLDVSGCVAALDRMTLIVNRGPQS